ncbi:MAG TPA: outer membrane protein assembly factor BamB [Gammaproteobacteria bacterium]|nr:outer membrane protein assembly factor BamB [Gammaproteobacteria bacterium]
MKKLICSVFVALLLAACASDNVEPPAMLKDLTKPQYRLDELWSRWVSSSDAKLLVNLRIAHNDQDAFIAANSGKVYAFELKSGGTDWSTKTGLTISAGPAVGDGMLVVAGEDGTVLALNPADGKTLWKSSVNGEVLANPAVGLGSVIIRTSDGRILSLASADGRVLWKTNYDVPQLTLRGASGPVIAGRMVIDGLDNGKLVALNLDDGTQLWQTTVVNPTGSDALARMTDVDGDLAVDGDKVYAVGYHGQAVSVLRVNGQIDWARDVTSYTGVSVDGDRVYVTDLHSAVWALDRTTGVPIWTQPEMRAHNLTVPVPFGDDAVVLGGIDGHFHFLSTKDGSEMARGQVGSKPILAPPVVIGNEVLVYSAAAGTLAAFQVTPVTGS